MVYDNNLPKAIDSKYNEELMLTLNAYKNKDLMRDVSCGYNQFRNEMYINIPFIETDEDYYEYKEIPYYSYVNNSVTQDFKRKLYGHIYVMNKNVGYVTKFGYQPTILNNGICLKEAIHPMQLVRRYLSTSIGELRSADIVASKYGNGTKDYTAAFMYIESPYRRNDYNYYPDSGGIHNIDTIYRDTDDILDVTYAPFWDDNLNSWLMSGAYPPIKYAPIKVVFKSAFFTGDAETMNKRVRKVLANIFSKGTIKLRGITISMEGIDNGIEYNQYAQALQEFTYPPTVTSYQPITANLLTGTDRNVISFIPQNPADLVTGIVNDWIGKPIKFSVEVESELRTQIDEIVIHLDPLYSYLF
jgi:hypothetical protein